MSKVYKFSNNGYEVEVVRREDVIECIENNIIDKEIAYEIINQLELDANNELSKGKWVGIPKIGSIRANPLSYKAMTDYQKDLIKDAKKLLDKDKYIMFRKQICIENKKRVQFNRYFNYILSISINRNKKLYKKICIEEGEKYADIYMYAVGNIKTISSEFLLMKEEYDNRSNQQ